MCKTQNYEKSLPYKIFHHRYFYITKCSRRVYNGFPHIVHRDIPCVLAGGRDSDTGGSSATHGMPKQIDLEGTPGKLSLRVFREI